mmetsp:Transcript_18989/g.21473  ORF Transcript_18989/g.21473 Transcript_18989/m.21473 type:complete len:578 (-) Transcript_18989:191-1924(-)
MFNRLFLHGRSGTPMLLQRLEEAQKKDNSCNDASLESMSISTSSISTSSSTSMPSTNNYYSSLLLSNWSMDEMDEEVLVALTAFLRKPGQKPCRRKRQRRRKPCNEIRTMLSSDSLQTSLFSQLSLEEEDKHQKEQPHGTSELQREVILHNCTGRERLQQLVILLMDTNSSITIRYDTQRKFPTYIAKGLQLGAATIFGDDDEDDFCPLRSLTFKGMIITPLTVNYLQMALPLLPNLEELTIQGKFTLIELDNNETSIAGHTGSKSMTHVVETLHKILRELPELKLLDLQRCHLPDEYLAHILEGLDHPTGSIETLKLNGNMTHEESQHVLCYQILSRKNCQLRCLDLSWQRLPHAKRNISILDVTMLSEVLANKNISLKTLNLSENRLLDEDVSQLAVAIARHPTLCSVRLQNCRMTDQGVVELANTLPKCSESLKHLFLDGKHRIDSATLVKKTFFQALLKNAYLRELALPCCCESDSIDWVLELNRAGRRVLLVPDERDCSDPAIECTIRTSPSFDSQNSRNQLPDALWPTILERADRTTRQEYYLNELESSKGKGASAIYLLLREKGYQSILR